MFFFLKLESTKYFENDDGFIFKKVNENEKTVYFDCLNEPRCLVAARLYKQAKSLKMFGNHSEFCPPDSKMKMKIHFEEFLRKDVLEDKNAAVTVLNLYKRAIEERYKGIWLPQNHRTDFLSVLRRLRNYHKTKPTKKSNLVEPKCKDVATSPIAQNPVGISNPKSPIPLGDESMATTSNGKSGNSVCGAEDNGKAASDTGDSVENQANASLVANDCIVGSKGSNLVEQIGQNVAISPTAQSLDANVNPRPLTPLDVEDMATTSNGKRSMKMCSDMATSPMHNTDFVCEDDGTAFDDSNEDRVNELVDTVQQHLNICVKSNGGSTLSVVSSSSHFVTHHKNIE